MICNWICFLISHHHQNLVPSAHPLEPNSVTLQPNMQFLITSFEIFVCFSLLLPLVLETFKILCSRVVSNLLSHAHTISNNIPFIICRFGATWRFPIQREKWLISIDCYGTCNTSHLKSLILEFQEKSS